MARLPRLTGPEMIRLLEGQGFQLLRVRGSHPYLGRGEQRTAVPVHGSHNLRIGTLRSILRDVGLSPTELEELWRDL